MAKNVYLTVPQRLVRERTGKNGKFFSVTLPSGVEVGGTNLSGAYFNPKFVNESKYGGEDYRDIPLLEDRLVWVKVPQRDVSGEILRDEDDHWVTETVKIDPADLKKAVDKARKEYLAKMAEKAAAAAPEETEPQGDTQGDAPWADEDIDF